jgi:hypothetical protein
VQPTFGPHIVIRRAGVWPGENGDPVVHCGDVLWLDGRFQPAGMRTGHIIWPADPPDARPGDACGPEIAKHIQMQLQELWRFRDGGGAIVALGATGSALYGAWARWRASLFIGGDVGGGKSYLLDTLRACCPMHYYTSDTSKAGLEQKISGRAMPSFIDEASDQIDQRGPQNLLSMITASAGGEGAKVARGTGDGKGRTAEIIGATFMASIAPPDMQPQHLARVAVVELQAPQGGEDHRAAMDALIAYCREHGPAIWARALVGHKRYTLALAALRDALGRAGCAPRQMDQLGAILSGFWVLTADGVPDDHEALGLVAAVRDHVQDASEVAENSAGRLVVEHLARSKLRKVSSVEEFPVGELAALAWQTLRDPDTGEAVESPQVDSFRAILMRSGIRAVAANEPSDHKGRPAPRGGEGDGIWIAFRAPAIVKIFADSPWPGQRWTSLIKSLPGVKFSKVNKIRIGGIHTAAAVWIPRAVLLGED